MRAWEEDSPGNRCGRARALTTLAPMSHRTVWRVKLRFLARRMMGPPRELNELSFIHYARTAVITKLGDGRGSSRHLPAYIYFESNFNGSFETYIDAFSYVVPHHMKKLWKGAYGFQGPKPATRFKRYIRAHDFEAGHFYSAYPEANATDISQALTVKERLAPLAASARLLAPEEFASRWFATIRDTPAPRGAKGSPAYLVRQLLALRHPRDKNAVSVGNVYGLTVLKPVRAGRVDDLREALTGVPVHEISPFAWVPGTHFARLVLIERFPDGRTPEGIHLPHLLFSAIADVEPGTYLRSLLFHMPQTVQAVWGHCEEMPPVAAGARAFERWMRRGQQTTTTFFAPYGEATVEDVTHALRLRHHVQAFTGRTQYETARALQRRFVREFVDPATNALR